MNACLVNLVILASTFEFGLDPVISFLIVSRLRILSDSWLYEKSKYVITGLMPLYCTEARGASKFHVTVPQYKVLTIKFNPNRGCNFCAMRYVVLSW